ncbi:MAG: WecB/TagA/CpsF family glycosyltransferase [Lachnospiraceae bacterium]|nr:WecB/TagA/CpsF family glycosyltransferase [Lachnospiraceae bacterium]
MTGSQGRQLCDLRVFIMNKTELMGVSISDLTVRECLSRASGYLRKGSLDVIYYISRDTLLAAKDSPELKGLIREADLVLPDSIDILKACGILSRSREKEIERNLFLKSFLKMLSREKSRIFCLADSDEKADTLMADLRLIQDGLKNEGRYVAGEDEDPENIVNEINMVSPEVIFCSFGSPLQERFIAQKKKINAKLMILVTPGMLDVREDGTINNSGLLNLLRTRLFRRQAKKYEMDKESVKSDDNP